MPVSPPVHYAPLPHEVWFAYLALRLRFKKGVTADPPKQFIKARQEDLLRHCETDHPKGWEALKAQVAEQRAAEEAAV